MYWNIGNTAADLEDIFISVFHFASISTSFFFISFKALAEAAFAKLIMRGEVPDPKDPEFTQLVAFLDGSDQREEFLQKLAKVCTKRFSKERGPKNEFLVTCSGDQEVFNFFKFWLNFFLHIKVLSVGYGGFWLLSLLEEDKDNVTTILQSFKILSLGPIVYMGVWGDRQILGRSISNHEFIPDFDPDDGIVLILMKKIVLILMIE